MRFPKFETRCKFSKIISSFPPSNFKNHCFATLPLKTICHFLIGMLATTFHKKKYWCNKFHYYYYLFSTWLFSNLADSKNTVRSSNDNGKLSNFTIQNLDITKFWRKSSILMFKFTQILAVFKAWMAKLDNLPVSLELLTVFFESARFEKSHVLNR